ncbi:MAG: iron-containing alcohol dehydrogenase [Planctomycetota bacterium]|nr:iron-containing alcohol dehydrogenase [Planctomycetota bacterium]
MQPFDYRPTTRVICGDNSVDRLGEVVSELGGTRVLLVSDPGIVKAGHTDHGAASLRDAGLEVSVFSHVQENPTTENVDVGLQFAIDHEIDFIVGLGGGSSMDCAKGINFLISNGGEMKDYWGVGKATKPMLPLIAVPTTSGTGSEAQSFALITDPESHRKMACGDKKAACRAAILDPILTVTQPREVTVATGIDAIAHSLETFVTQRRNPISLLFSREAWRHLHPNLQKVLEDPEDVEARGHMQIGANLAGAAIENSMLGATHASANPLTATYGITHGIAIGMMLPHVIRFNGASVDEDYSELARLMNERTTDGTECLAQRVTEISRICQLPSSLQEAGVEETRLSELAEAATKEWTGTFNPRPLNKDDFLGIYQAAFNGRS